MRVVIQRVRKADVTVDNKLINAIASGYVILAGFTFNDEIKDIDYIVKKIKFMRLFDDINGIMNIDITNAGGSILSISQFTLYADTKNGRRPSYAKALKYDEAYQLYRLFNNTLKEEGLDVKEGIFGADMQVSLIYDGPVTIIIDSREDI